MMSKEFWSVYCPKSSCLLLISGWWECLSASLDLGSIFRNGNSARNRPVFWDRSGCSEAVRYKSAVKEVFFSVPCLKSWTVKVSYRNGVFLL